MNKPDTPAAPANSTPNCPMVPPEAHRHTPDCYRTPAAPARGGHEHYPNPVHDQQAWCAECGAIRFGDGTWLSHKAAPAAPAKGRTWVLHDWPDGRTVDVCISGDDEKCGAVEFGVKRVPVVEQAALDAVIADNYRLELDLAAETQRLDEALAKIELMENMDVKYLRQLCPAHATMSEDLAAETQRADAAEDKAENFRAGQEEAYRQLAAETQRAVRNEALRWLLLKQRDAEAQRADAAEARVRELEVIKRCEHLCHGESGTEDCPACIRLPNRGKQP